MAALCALQATRAPAQAVTPSPVAETVIRLTLRDALDRALSSKPAQLEPSAAALRTASIGVRSARAAGALQLSGAVSEREVRIDLRTLGIALPVFPLTEPPQYNDLTGPFGVLEPELRATKVLIDRAAARAVAESQSKVTEARDAVSTERETIAAATVRAYLKVLRLSEEVEAVQREVELGQTLQKVAEAETRQSLASAAEVRRARIGLNGRREQLLSVRLEQKRAVLQLAYLIGSDFHDTLVLSDELAERQPSLTEEQAVAEAEQSNPRLLALHAHAQTLELHRDAIAAERLPVLAASADTELNVVTPTEGPAGGVSDSLTYNAAVELRIPIFDGHRRSLETAEVASQMQEQQVEEKGMRREVEMETRVAYAALEQTTAALKLARQDLDETQSALSETQTDRANGTASGVDVQQAETDCATAEDAVTGALYAQEEARLSLAEVLGNVASLNW